LPAARYYNLLPSPEIGFCFIARENRSIDVHVEPFDIHQMCVCVLVWTHGTLCDFNFHPPAISWHMKYFILQCNVYYFMLFYVVFVSKCNFVVAQTSIRWRNENWLEIEWEKWQIWMKKIIYMKKEYKRRKI
jgi:hypothetical protein